MTVQFTTTADEEQAEKFKLLTKRLGTSPADVLRLFIYSFNAYSGFSYIIRVPKDKAEHPFDTENEAMDFAESFVVKSLRKSK